jgi:hypothetical protein
MPKDYTKQLYNEVILDSAPWIANMPSSITAVYYVAVDSDQVSAERRAELQKQQGKVCCAESFGS